MSRWGTERQFEAHFYGLTDPVQQVKDLAEWRAHQIEVVSKFIDQIRLMANDQYTNLDHFLLELLQNADDNQYGDGVQPSVRLTLTRDSFRLVNNERGFTAQDLYAITYAAASTKVGRKVSGTFIGEKGIGFKSVFAVADSVDIHSGPYHFSLRNGEFIIPHPLDPRDVKGTEILLRLRKGNTTIPETLSQRLEALCENAREFIIFLQRIEELHVDDRISGSKRKVIALRDAETGYFVVEGERGNRTFVSHTYSEIIPGEVVETRFPDMGENLPRPVVFATPVPGEDDQDIARSGRLFCFLPTEVRTGTPIHLQLDAKTTTNRENVAEFAVSPWPDFDEIRVSQATEALKIKAFRPGEARKA